MKILVVSHEKTDVDLFRMHCREGFDPELKWLHISDQGEIIQILSEKKFDVMCTNPVSPEGWNLDYINPIAKRFPTLPLIIYCGQKYETNAMESLNNPAWDYFIIDDINKDNLYKTLIFNVKRIKQYEHFINASEEIREAKEYSNRLLARMSHEIRTPMNAVIGMTEMLYDTDLNSKQRYYTQTIHESGTLLVALFNDLLDFSKIEAGTIRIHDKPFLLHESMRESISSVLQFALEKRLELIYHIEPEMPLMVMGDDLRLRQIVMNLLDNAIKFTPHGYVKLFVRKSVFESKEEINISVSDTGPGIRSDLLPHLFKPYVQASEYENVQKKGIGLGLAICEQLAKRMNGKIDVVSVMGEGSTFTIRLPFRPLEESLPEPKKQILENKKAVFITYDSLLDELLTDYCKYTGMSLEIVKMNLEYPVFGDQLNNFDLLITHLHPGLKIDLKLIDSVREKRDIPHILIKEREKANEKMVVIRKDTVIMLKPIDPAEFWDVAEAVIEGKANNLNTIERHIQLDERMGEYHPLDILVAEDNAINQRIIMSVLNRYGYHVKMVENGKEALESLERRLYDVVLMDIQMPVLDGIKATKLIRERFNSNRQPYIIALTADALQQSRTEYLTHGMDEVLYKPVQTKALMQLLANCQRLDRSKRGN
ncbi:MAG: response regulator [Bacteroidetes bacterium]|nr:response regulator [Bacteroidota bacterium]